MVFSSGYEWTNSDYISSVVMKLIFPIATSLFGVWFFLACYIMKKKIHVQKTRFFLMLSIVGATSLLVTSSAFPLLYIIQDLSDRITQLFDYKQQMANILFDVVKVLQRISVKPYVDTCPAVNVTMCQTNNLRIELDNLIITTLIPNITYAGNSIATIFTEEVLSTMKDITYYANILHYVLFSMFFTAFVLAFFVAYHRFNQVKPSKHPRRQNAVGIFLSLIALSLTIITLAAVIMSSDVCESNTAAGMSKLIGNDDIDFYFKCNATESDFPPDFAFIQPYLNDTFILEKNYLLWCNSSLSNQYSFLNENCTCKCNKTDTDKLANLVNGPNGMDVLYPCAGPQIRLNQLIEAACRINPHLIAGFFLLLSLTFHLLLVFFPRLDPSTLQEKVKNVNGVGVKSDIYTTSV